MHGSPAGLSAHAMGPAQSFLLWPALAASCTAVSSPDAQWPAVRLSCRARAPEQKQLRPWRRLPGRLALPLWRASAAHLENLQPGS